MNRKEIEQRITDMVTAQLRDGKAPWRKPWNGAGYLPTSLQTGKPYRGVNSFMLALLGAEYERSLWVTFKQAKHLGGHVRKGAKGYPVVFYSMITKRNAEGEETRVPLLRLSTVFNVEQCEGLEIPAKFLTRTEPVAVLDGLQALLDKYTSKPEIYHRAGDQAFYRPSDDTITVPMREQYETAEGYAYTLAHELTHSTSHESRLNRKAESGFAPFGSPSYAEEELVADIGAQMVLSTLGVSIDMPNSASYLAGWLEALQNDTSMIIKASSKAQRAADYMLGVKFETAIDTDEEEVVTA